MKGSTVYTDIVTFFDRIDCFGFIQKKKNDINVSLFLLVLYVYFKERF